MKKYLSIVVILSALFLGLPASAGVEPRLAGDWTLDSATGPSTVFHVDTNGRFRTVIGGAQVETGLFNAIDGKWSIQAEQGRYDSGTFSIIAGEMVLRSSTGVASHWKRGQAASSPTEAGKTAGITSSSGIQNSGSFAQGYQSLSRGLTSGSNNVAPDTSQFQAGQAQTSPQLQTGISVQNQVVETPVATAPPIATPLKQALNLEDAYRAAQAGATIAQAARGFRGGVKSGIANIIGAAQQLGAQNAANNAYVANRAISPVMPSVIPPGKNAGLSSVFGGGGFSQSMPSGGSSYSDMRKAFNQQQLSALPPAMAVSVNPQGDETAEYGLATYESRAFGAVRINRLSTVHGSEELAGY